MTAPEILEKITRSNVTLISSAMGIDCPTITVAAENLLTCMGYLKQEQTLGFDLIVDITAVDYPGRSPRFDVVYHVFSIKNGQRIRVKTPVAEGGFVASVTGIWRGAEWLEREVFDMFGIAFDGHPDLRRILMDEDFKYYPLRKDFPLQGYEES